METVLKANGITKYFFDPVKYQVLKDISFSIEKGSFVSIVGKSGCGKSTLLYILSTMDTVYEGELVIDGEALHAKSSSELAQLRNQKIGFVFQFHYLLPEFNVLKNVMLPGLKLNRLTAAEVEHKAILHLRKLGIEDQALKHPHHLSGGQKQRVAIARALINDPLIIMGDEPTGNLDKKNTDMVFDLLKLLSSENNQTILVVTHDLDFSKNTSQVIEMDDGKILSVHSNATI